MASLIRHRTSWIMLALLAATALSWASGHAAIVRSDRVAATCILLIAGIKIHLVMMDFMEVRQAPLVLRCFGTGWLWVTIAVLIVQNGLLPTT